MKNHETAQQIVKDMSRHHLSARMEQILTAEITRALDAQKTSAYEQGRREGFGQCAKLFKTWALEQGISGAKVSAFVKSVQP